MEFVLAASPISISVMLSCCLHIKLSKILWTTFHVDLLSKSSVGSQNPITLIFTKMAFCQCGHTKRMAHILSNSRSSRPIRTPLKSINSASKYLIYGKFHYFGSHFTEICGFALKKMLKMS